MNVIYRLLFLLLVILTGTQVVAQTHSKGKVPKEIIIYGSPDCHYCTDVKNLLIEKKISFVFYDIDTNKEALNEMLTKLQKANISTQNLGIPVIDKYGEIISNNATFEDFLKKIIQ